MINDKPSLDALAHYGVKGMKWGVRRQERKQLRAERKAYDKKRIETYKAEKQKAKGNRSYKRSRAYKDAKNDYDNYKTESKYLRGRNRDRLYRDVKAGKDYTNSFTKYNTRELFTSVGIIAAAKLAPAGGLVALNKWLSYEDTSNLLRLPASDILEAKVRSVRTV